MYICVVFCCYVGCPIDFSTQNYTILTSQCKGPRYPPNQCCSSFLDFSCPFAEQLDDNTTDCSDQMFHYIHTFYPPGLFANECSSSSSSTDQGLDCPHYLNISGTTTSTSTNSLTSTLSPFPPFVSRGSSNFVGVLGWIVVSTHLIITFTMPSISIC